jgi:hypothetical protein
MRFETPEQKAKESALAEQVAEMFGYQQLELSDANYGIDRQFWKDGKLALWVEVKIRPGLNWGFGDGYYISLAKVMRAKALTAETGLRCLLVVQFGNGRVCRADFAAVEEGRLVLHGPNPPRDEFDLEPCRVLPWTAFAMLPIARETAA